MHGRGLQNEQRLDGIDPAKFFGDRPVLAEGIYSILECIWIQGTLPLGDG